MDSRETKCHGNWGGVTTHCCHALMKEWERKTSHREGSQEAMGVLMREGRKSLLGKRKVLAGQHGMFSGQRWTGWNVEEMEAELRQAGPHRPLKMSAFYLRAIGSHARLRSSGWSKILILLVVVGWKSKEGAAAGIRERCQVFPMMPPVGVDGRVQDPFLKTKPQELMTNSMWG